MYKEREKTMKQAIDQHIKSTRVLLAAVVTGLLLSFSLSAAHRARYLEKTPLAVQ